MKNNTKNIKENARKAHKVPSTIQKKSYKTYRKLDIFGLYDSMLYLKVRIEFYEYTKKN